MKISRPVWLFGIIATISFLSIDGRSYNRYHSEEGSVKHRLSSTSFGNFQVYWDTVDPYFYVIHISEPDKILFQTLPSQSFVTVGYATDSNPPIVDGNYKVSYPITNSFAISPVSSFSVVNLIFIRLTVG